MHYPAKASAIRRVLSVILVASMALALTPIVAIAPPPPPTFYVDVATGSDVTGDGSAGNPFMSMSRALTDTIPPDSTVIVAPGVYDSTVESFPIDVAAVTLKSSGGPDVTIVQGQWRSSNFHVFDTYATIQGFTIRDGDSIGGGGIYADMSKLLVKDCIFTQNIALEGAGIAAFRCNLDIVDCTFDDNGWVPDAWAKKPPPKLSASMNPTMPPIPEYDPDDIWVSRGGAIMSRDTSMVVTGSTFVDNAAAYAGGAVHIDNSKAPPPIGTQMDDTVFKENVCDSSGGIVSGVIIPPDSWLANEMELAGKGGPDEGIGGAVYVNSSKFHISDMEFHRNYATMGGAVFSDLPAQIRIDDSEFTENTAEGLGGGVCKASTRWVRRWWRPGMLEGGKLDPADATLLFAEDPDEVLEDEEPSPEGPPWRASMWIQHSEFIGNGGLVPAVFHRGHRPMFMENDLVAENAGDWAAVVAQDMGFRGDSILEGLVADSRRGSPSWVNQTTFANNVGVGLSADLDFGLVSNSLFWGNDYRGRFLTSIDLGADQAPRFEECQQIDAWAWLGVEYSDLENGYGWAGKVIDDISDSVAAVSADASGNISADPQWADPVSGDYRLTFGSPCVDMAAKTVMGLPAGARDDLDFMPRPVDGDLDGTKGYDMGAYELEPREPGTTDRLWGENRFATAIEISKEYFPTADAVILARADVFADGLTAAGLAGALHAPVLLTMPDYLPDEVADEIVRLGATKVVLSGGPTAISPAVMAELQARGYEVQRVGGANRYETAAMMADEILAVTGAETHEITFVARGDNWPDALAVSPVAFAQTAPILLVEPDALPPATVDVLQEADGALILGGKMAVGSRVAKAIDPVVDVDRIGGSNRYATAVGIADFSTAMGWTRWEVTGLATGADFADALTGGPGLGRLDGVLLLTDPASLSPDTAAALTANKMDIVRLDLLGGPAALPTPVKNEAKAIVN